MLRFLSEFTTKFRWPIVVGWVVLAIFVILKTPVLSDVAKTDNQSFLPGNMESIKADKLLRDLYPDKSGASSLTLVMKRKGGITAKDRDYVENLENYLKKHESRYHVKEIISPFSQKEFEKTMTSKNKEVALVIVNLTAPSFRDVTNEVVRSLRADVQSRNTSSKKGAPPVPAGLTINATGDAAISQEKVDTIQESMALTGKITVILVAIILILIYRSPIAPLVPLLTIGLSFLISRGLVAELTTFGLKVSSFTETFLIAILFGAGTDYCLLVISRFREELSLGRSAREALHMTLPKAGEAVISSGGTVIVGFAFMIFAKFGLYNTTGPSIAIGVGITILAAMTLTPALLAILGERVFWPIHPTRASQRNNEGLFWMRLSRSVTSRPLRFIAVSFVLLIPFLLYANSVTRSFDQLTDLPDNKDAVKGFQVLKSNFKQGELVPIKIVLKTDKDMWSTESLKTLDTMVANISKIDNVATVRTATQPLGEKIAEISLLGQVKGFSDRLEQIKKYPTSNNQPSVGLSVSPEMIEKNRQLRKAMDYYIAPGGNGIIVDAVVATPPYANGSLDTIDKIKKVISGTLRGSSLEKSEFYIGGGVSGLNDLRRVTADDLINVMVFVLAGIFLILVILLRSLIAPIYLLLSILISFVATMGITGLVFQVGLGYEGLDWSVPFFAFCLLVALGVDYNIFLMSRVKEEYASGGDITGGVARALSSTGKIITSCGIIMAGTFGALMVSPLDSLVTIGFATFIGLLLDTFIIRSLLVPAIAVTLGEFNWWPSRRKMV